METYLQVFDNFERNDWAKLLPMAKFAYNNTKNASTNHMSFELNCDFYLQASYKKDVDPRSQSKSIAKLVIQLKKLMAICKKNL